MQITISFLTLPMIFANIYEQISYTLKTIPKKLKWFFTLDLFFWGGVKTY